LLDLATIALGFVLATVGTTAVVLSAAYWRAAGVALLSFGLLTSLYGVRLLIGVEALEPLLGLSPRTIAFTTAFLLYALPVPGLLYAEQIRGRGWRSSLRRLWQIGLVLAAVFGAYDVGAGRPWASLPAYRAYIIVVMVVLLPHVMLWRHRDPIERVARTIGTTTLALSVIHDNLVGFRLLPWRVSFEVFGIGVFILALGVVTARRFFADQRELAVVDGEMATARAIQAAILPQAPPSVRDLVVDVRYVPARSVAGDIYDFLPLDDRRLTLLVADVTGHSVPAALIASMVKVAFSSQRPHADAPGRVLTEMNRVLCGHFEGRFVTAACVFLDADRPLVRYSLAGHPPPLLLRGSTGEILELPEGGLVLGLFPDAGYPTGEVRFDPGDRILLYTDGITEARDASGAWFGDRELRAFVAAHRDGSAAEFLDALLAHVRRWAGRNSGPFDDDLTIVAIDRRRSDDQDPGARSTDGPRTSPAA
jgi:sigma-B regulation protein RsbU (phosphoserine phosphatase)